ncbi:tyrosine-type recombinase/integrase [Aquabacterium sp.]|uniref:tyrosine-type recombinase/integrase n=1 Tax=Aquabacterium sp. TaxID=1872578 RepID=UPI0035AD8ED1
MLTDPACKNATCPQDKPRIRLADAGGLYLEVTPNGSKRWFAKYRFDGKEKRLALGSYPSVSLKAARDGRDQARKARESGSDPVQVRQAEKLSKAVAGANTYEVVAREFHGVKSAGWSSGHAAKWLRMNELYLFPHIGSLPLGNIKAPSLLATLRKAEAKGILSTAQDLHQMAGQVFRYGIQTGYCEHNPASDLKGALKPHIAKHFSAVLDPVQAGGLLRAIDGYTGQPTTLAALQLSALFFQRPGNIRSMEWTWVDLEGAMLTIPPSQMKRKLHEKVNGKPHLVPLSTQAVRILSSIKPLTGNGRYVFPGARDHTKPMSDGTINAALRRLDFGNDEHVAHGFRAMARTMIAERIPGIPADMVEAQLGHGKSGPWAAPTTGLSIWSNAGK